MKIISYITILTLILFFAPSTIFADTSVTVNNSINSSVSSSSTGSTHTSVRIETNGQVKTYESDQPGNIHIQSDDGHTQVNINNQVSQTPTPSINIQKQKEKIQVKVEKIKQDQNNNIDKIIADIESFLRNIFSSILR